MRWSILALACMVAAVFADDKKDKEKDIGTVIGIDLGTTYSWWVSAEPDMFWATPIFQLSHKNDVKKILCEFFSFLLLVILMTFYLNNKHLK